MARRKSRLTALGKKYAHSLLREVNVVSHSRVGGQLTICVRGDVLFDVKEKGYNMSALQVIFVRNMSSNPVNVTLTVSRACWAIFKLHAQGSNRISV
jgi:hypothetical protein